jgi:hypothetical protein
MGSIPITLPSGSYVLIFIGGGNMKGNMKGNRKTVWRLNMKTVWKADELGRFRIEVDGITSIWAPYTGIATVRVNGVTYMGVSAYFEGMGIPTETVFKVEPLR